MRLLRWTPLLSHLFGEGRCAPDVGQTSDRPSSINIFEKGQRSDHDRILEKLHQQHPIGMRKMSDDEGEMFFLNYWSFDHLAYRAQSKIEQVEEGRHNMTVTSLNPPLLPHQELKGNNAAIRIAQSLFKRAFTCPAGTFACVSIGQSNSCCSQGETCISVQDTGLGPVGCCPQGANCGGAVAGCDTGQGFTGCPGSPNGGCCIPGYSCSGVGCISIGTAVLTNTPAATTVRPDAVTPSSSIQTVTTTVVITSSSSAEPTTVIQTLTIVPSSASSESNTITTSAVAPVRPTSDSDTSSASGTSAAPTTSLLASTTPPADEGCPTAFYRCSAYYVGGCCRVGRDCSSTSCPPASSTTVLAGQPTVVAPAGASAATVQGSCQSGWASCAPSLGGGCCPSSGYACGVSQCTATVTGQSNVGKEATTSGAHVDVPGLLFMASGCLVGVALVVL